MEEEEEEASPATAANTGTSVQVAVRVRPLLAQEAGTDNCCSILHQNTCIRIGGNSGPTFTFDRVFDPSTQQATIYAKQVDPLVESCLEGYNATILAYGQTGSGKTHTIMGPYASTANQDDAAAGVIPRAVRKLFHRLEHFKKNSSNNNNSTGNTALDGGDCDCEYEYHVRVQFLELYGEEIRDLLTTGSTAASSNNSSGTGSWSSPDKLTIRDIGMDEPEVVGATQQTVGTAEDALLCLTHGMLRRVTGATAMNESSSRSHAILSVMVEQTTTTAPTTTTSSTTATSTTTTSNADAKQEKEVQVKRSKFNFVDLAGSERQKRTQAAGKRLREGIDINKGLLVLGNVISALGDPKKRGKTFVPYRDSKLTRLLKGSLGGNHKTLMIACVSPSSDNMDESLSCLRYANRAKNIQNNAVVNVDATSQRLTELKNQVQTLASDFLRVQDSAATATASGVGNAATVTSSFSRSVLETLAAGGEAKTGSVVPASPQSVTPSRTSFASSSNSNSNSNSNNGAVEQQLRDAQLELSRTRDQLRQSQNNHDTAEEQLYAVKAEKELYRLQMSVLQDHGNDEEDDGDGALTPTLGEADKQFLQKASQYETEIGRLRNALRTSEAKADRLALVQSELMNYSDDNTDDIIDGKSQVSIEKAKEALENDRQRLSSLQSALLSQEESDLETLATHGIQRNESLATEKASQFDAEERAEEAQLQSLTTKYLEQGGHDEEDDNTDGTVAENDTENLQTPPSPGQKHRYIEADLVELSRGIAAKEDLIDQLKLSQEKYASMRDFYEEKLERMGVSLREKEMEREQLVRELDQTKEVGVSAEIASRLREKEKHIASLRKKQKELRNLTSVSSRNDSEISRLQTDVKSMKHKKVSLQKQMTEERKAHAIEVKRMQKTAMQKDREMSKLKKTSNQHEMQAQKANQVAKARLGELGNLRTKYKDTEKRLKRLSLKRGVLAKAGLDPIIVGRRDSDRTKKEAASKVDGSRAGATVDADLLRDHFDKKVADVVRKEAIVDRLAQEWEEHFELTLRRDELKLEDIEDAEDSLQSLSVRIRFKEDRIRHLAKRLGKQQQSTTASNVSSVQRDSFLYDDAFEKICKGASPELAKSTAARILFGMIVRERRRIAALARTASSLDDKLQVAEKATEVSEAALRSYMDDQRHEFTALSQAQQEQILSLMDMVREDADLSVYYDMIGHRASSSSENVIDPKLVILANERIRVLERQLQELQSELQVNESYRERLGELTNTVGLKIQECDDLQEELSDLRAALRQIREATSTAGGIDSVAEYNGLGADVLEIVDGALHPSRTPFKVKRGSPRSKATGSSEKSSRNFLSPRLKKHVELMHTSDSAEESDAPEWAADIMADLALIAEGKIPPALEGSPLILAVGSQLEEGNVFDRLNDPENFTGVQKQVRSKRPTAVKAKRSKSPSSQGQEVRKAMSREIADRLDKITIPDVPSSELAVTPMALAGPSSGAVDLLSIESKPEHRSVFERLMSPSQYTGTQKGRFEKSQAKRDKVAEEVADRLLDDLLESDNERQENGRGRGESARKTDYTEQDVFERLQRTATHSYALKHNGTMLPDTSFYDGRGSSSIHGTPDERRGVPRAEPAADDSLSSGYKRLNVFERLQKTTTEAFAKKTNKGKQDGTEGG